MRGLGIEESEGLGGTIDAARGEKLGEDKRKTGVAGERNGFFRARLGEEPALRRQRAR